MDLFQNNLLEQVAITPELSLSKVFAEHWNEIQETELESIHIKATPTENLEITQSKFGGNPWLPEDFEYPVDGEGKPMFLLAQLNFNETPKLEGYLLTGILQFYISTSESMTYGLDFENELSKDGYKILYFENIQDVACKAEFPTFESEALYNLPLSISHALQFEKQNEYIGIGDVRYEEFGSFKVDDWIEKFPLINEQLENEVYEKFSYDDHKIGGYAYFTQWDPRQDSKYKDYLLLLQIDSDNEIMWDDSDVGNFFIHPEDLKKKDFSKVLYNWDCC